MFRVIEDFSLCVIRDNLYIMNILKIYFCIVEKVFVLVY